MADSRWWNCVGGSGAGAVAVGVARAVSLQSESSVLGLAVFANVML